MAMASKTGSDCSSIYFFLFLLLLLSCPLPIAKFFSLPSKSSNNILVACNKNPPCAVPFISGCVRPGSTWYCRRKGSVIVGFRIVSNGISACSMSESGWGWKYQRFVGKDTRKMFFNALTWMTGLCITICADPPSEGRTRLSIDIGSYCEQTTSLYRKHAKLDWSHVKQLRKLTHASKSPSLYSLTRFKIASWAHFFFIALYFCLSVLSGSSSTLSSIGISEDSHVSSVHPKCNDFRTLGEV